MSKTLKKELKQLANPEFSKAMIDAGVKKEYLPSLLSKLEDIQKKKQAIHEKSEEITKLTKPSMAGALKKCMLKAEKREANELLGYKLNKFKEITEKVDGIREGLVLIVADPNIGKSTFQRNIFFDFLDSNQNLYSLFVTLDDSLEDTIYSLVAMLAQLPINTIKKTKNISKELREKIESAYAKLRSFGDRLCILDAKLAGDFSSISHFIESEISTNKEKQLIVFIDAIFNLDTDENSSISLREKNIHRANELKRIAETYEIPVICTCEVRKRNNADKAPTIQDIMESSKFAYNAKLIWIMHYKDANTADQPEAVLVLKWDKNKMSGFKGKTELLFIREKALMLENHHGEIAKEINRVTESSSFENDEENYDEFMQ